MSVTDDVLAALSLGDSLLASEIAEKTKLTADQVSNSLFQLGRKGHVVKEGEKRPYRWRIQWDAATQPINGKRRAAEPVDPAGTDTETDDAEIFVGAFASGDVQIGVGEEALHITEHQARHVHRLLERMFGPNE